MKAEELKNIFYSGYNATPEWAALHQIASFIEKKILLYETKKLSLKQNYYDLIDPIKASEGPGPQTKRHMALKEITQQFLAKTKLESRAEQPFLGAHPDVLSQDFSWIIECGTTPPGSVLLFLQDKRVKNVGILPYPYEDDKYLILHLFSRGKSFDQQMIDQKGSLRSVFDKFHYKNFKT